MTKLEKSYILSDVVEKVRANSGVGGFVKKDKEGRWYEVGDFLAREKTSQAFRDVLHDKYKSSNTSKKKRRQEEQAEKLFRTQSNRSLDGSSVHTTGSAIDTGNNYMSCHDSQKFMRMELPNLVGSNIGEPSSEDLLSSMDDQLFPFGGRKGLASQRLPSQRSQRSVMEFDRRQAMMQQARSGPSAVNHSCPNLFNQPNPVYSNSHQRPANSNHPPIPTQVVLEDSIMEPTPMEPVNSSDISFSSSPSGMNFHMGQARPSLAHSSQGMAYTHLSQPNLFATPNSLLANHRRQFTRMPPRQSRSFQNTGRQASLQNVMGRQSSLRSIASGPPGSHLLQNTSQHSANHVISVNGSTTTDSMNSLSTSGHSRHSMTVQLDNLALSDRSAPRPPQQPSRSHDEPQDVDIDELVLSPMRGETKDSLLASLASLSNSFAIDPIDENPFDSNEILPL
jgi:hypothetical protein